MKKIHVLTLLLVLVSFIAANAQQKTNPKNQDEELGKVAWYRDYEQAAVLSAKENKPIFILFQEVPGCATCRNYGHNVMSNPLLVEAIENEFIPLAIFNNKGGKDKQILQKYNEPTWNNPVVHIVDNNGKNLTKRIAGDYSALAVYNAITEVLQKEGKEIPKYITLLGQELKGNKYGAAKETYYSMYCFWTGEKQLGSNEGVLNTEAGFMKGHEVVKVTYNPEIVSDKTLTSFAQQNKMAPIQKDNSYRASSKDEDYYLQHSNFKYIPLTPLQRTKINSALGNRKSAEQYLSPRQLKWLHSKNSSNVVFNKDFLVSWNSMSSL
ncbi:VPGUxxT family thioredoxin-like (seleno)protein, type 2 [Rasiella sp. SM2506]|uniref:VPGUxxT family thioredoxin-like (seleno)protein, type 2 n=1 Tax=Rasiella sp. SM2506 TaxID=3423914 RepID=UPI003D78E175